MMKKHHFSTAGKLCLATMLLLLYAGIPPAQAQSPTPDSLTRYKWEIANDLIWMLGERQGSRFSVLVRKNITTQNGKYRAWRLRVGGNYSIGEADDEADNNFTEDFRSRRFTFLIRSGYEWQKQFGRFQINYGLDAELQWSGDKTKNIVNDPGDPVSSFSETNFESDFLIAGFVGFLGTKYFISPRWMLSTELNLHISYIHGNSLNKTFSRREDTFPPAVSEFTQFTRTKQNSFNTRFNPIAFIQISYFF